MDCQPINIDIQTIVTRIRDNDINLQPDFQRGEVWSLNKKKKLIDSLPFYDVKYFIQEKYRIAGDKPGSGNTENIGSFSTKDFSELKDGEGPFHELGVDAFDLYWRYYPKYRSADKAYTSLDEFVEWFPEQSKSDVELLHPYDYDSTLNRILTCARKLSGK